MQTYSLEDARKAASQLKSLEDAASQLPFLEQENSKRESLAHLETLRVNTQKQIATLYADYNAVYETYRSQFDNMINAMRETAQSLKRLFSLRKQITDKIQQYAGSKLEFSLSLEGRDVYRDGQIILMQAEQEVSNGLVLERQLTPNTASPLFSDLLRLLQVL